MLVYAGIVAITAFSRGGLGNMLLLKSESAEGVHDETGRALGLILILATLLASIVLAATVSLDGHFRLLICGLLVAPFQDCSRIAAIAKGRPGVAIIGDGLWFTVSGALLVSTWVGVQTPQAAAITIWLCGGLIASATICVTLGVRPQILGISAWLSSHAADRTRLAVEASVAASGSLVMAASVTSLLGATANAALRGAGTLLGPINVLLASVQIALVPELRRQSEQGYRHLSRIAAPVITLVALLGVGASLFALFAPPKVGRILLGDSWSVVAPVLVVTGIEYVGQAILANATAVLRSRIQTRELVRVRMALTFTQLAACICTAAVAHSAIPVAVASALVVWTLGVGANLIIATRPTPVRRSLTERT